jgi:hypothetical protein
VAVAVAVVLAKTCRQHLAVLADLAEVALVEEQMLPLVQLTALRDRPVAQLHQTLAAVAAVVATATTHGAPLRGHHLAARAERELLLSDTPSQL